MAPAGAITSDIPHEYARSLVGGRLTRFFDGKRLRSSSGATTRIKTLVFGRPMTLHVESVDGFEEGAPLLYYDIQEGDTATLVISWHGHASE